MEIKAVDQVRNNCPSCQSNPAAGQLGGALNRSQGNQSPGTNGNSNTVNPTDLVQNGNNTLPNVDLNTHPNGKQIGQILAELNQMPHFGFGSPFRGNFLEAHQINKRREELARQLQALLGQS
jgi:hypothetical protein